MCLTFNFFLGGNVESRFSMDNQTGVLSLVKALDRETRSNYTLTIVASDNLHTSICEVQILVQDQNDNDPVFQSASYDKSIYENIGVGETVLIVLATDSDSGKNGEVTYSLYNDSDASLFAINSASGVITTKG